MMQSKDKEPVLFELPSPLTKTIIQRLNTYNWAQGRIVGRTREQIYKGELIQFIKSFWWNQPKYYEWMQIENYGIDEPYRLFWDAYKLSRRAPASVGCFYYPSIIHPNSLSYEIPAGYYTKSAKTGISQ